MNRILIVEDEIHIINPVEKGLRTQGFITVVAKDGRTAIDLARDADFDLVLLDLGLPDVDGKDFAFARSKLPKAANIPAHLAAPPVAKNPR
jgi:DNA-binding response OmpR family regulator